MKKPLSNAFDRGNLHQFLTFIQTIVEETASNMVRRKKSRKLFNQFSLSVKEKCRFNCSFADS